MGHLNSQGVSEPCILSAVLRLPGKERIGDKGGQKGKGRGKGIKSGPGREFAISKALCRILRHQAGQLGLPSNSTTH
eukprot:6467831-Amphidinium_carterae.1